MRRSRPRRRFPAWAPALTALLALSGCGDGTPAVSSSNQEATVHGTVRYKGVPVTKGEIRFDPANVRRRDAKMAAAPIGKDGTYTVKTLAGGNRVGFTLPTLARTKDFGLPSRSFHYDAPGGDSTYEIELSPAGR